MGFCRAILHSVVLSLSWSLEEVTISVDASWPVLASPLSTVLLY